jgi:hypothetical protein
MKVVQPRRASARSWIEARTLLLRSTDLVGVLEDDLEAALRGQTAEIRKLRLGVLIDGQYPRGQDTLLHQRWPFFFGSPLNKALH